MRWWRIWRRKFSSPKRSAIRDNSTHFRDCPRIARSLSSGGALRRPVGSILATHIAGFISRASGPKTLRRTRDRLAAAGGHPHYREAALVGAIGAETKQPIDAGEAGGVSQRFRRKALSALGSRQRRDQRHRIIGQRRGSHRIGAEFGAVAAREAAKAGRIGRGVKPALQRRVGEHA